ncbi:unnamed protein product [Penicillium pancosmium]
MATAKTRTDQTPDPVVPTGRPMQSKAHGQKMSSESCQSHPKSFAGRAPLVCGSTFLATADYETPNDHSIPLVYTTPPTTTINPLPAKGWPSIGELIIPLAGEWLDHNSVDGSTEGSPITPYS